MPAFELSITDWSWEFDDQPTLWSIAARSTVWIIQVHQVVVDVNLMIPSALFPQLTGSRSRDLVLALFLPCLVILQGEAGFGKKVVVVLLLCLDIGAGTDNCLSLFDRYARHAVVVRNQQIAR